MAWTAADIQSDWLGDATPPLPMDELVGAFNRVEEVLGRQWIDSVASGGGWRTWGPGPTLNVATMGRRLSTLMRARSANGLIERLKRGDGSAYSELAAIHLLSADDTNVEVEISPEAVVGTRTRKPDFKMRRGDESWTYVEVTRAQESVASERVQSLLSQLSHRLLEVSSSFALEVILLREPTEDEARELVDRATAICGEGGVVESAVGDVASLLLNSSAPGQVVPTPLQDNVTRAAHAMVIGGGGEPARHVAVRVPFGDERAKEILTAEARQLPKDAPGLIAVDVSRQPTALTSWEGLIPARFTPTQHTRVSAVCLFMFATMLVGEGIGIRSLVKLMQNPHARYPLPSWISAHIDAIRAENRVLFGRPD